MEIKSLEYKDRIINLFGNIDEDISKDVIQKITEINISDDEYINKINNVICSAGFKVDPNYIEIPQITINLSTYGGICYDGFGLCDIIKSSNTPINIVCFGKIMSMGIPILLSGHHKVAHKNTTFMIHGISGGTYGKIPDLINDINETERLQNLMIDIILSNSKFPKRKLLNIFDKKEDYYFTTEEALQYKIIDEIV